MYVPAWPSLNPALFLRSRIDQEPPFPLDHPDSTYYYVARNGIYHLFRRLALGPDEVVLAPDYHHGNEIRAIRAAGATIRYYPVQRTLELDLEALERLCDRRARVLYVTHFIGWPQPVEALRRLCRDRGLLLVEDCALSFLSSAAGAPLGSFGDYSVFCLYKTLPLPNGGVLVRNTDRGPALGDVSGRRAGRKAGRLSVGARSAELVLQWLRSRHERLGATLFALKRGSGRALSRARVARVSVGDSGFDPAAADTLMSPACHRLLGRIRFAEVRERRRRNFRRLAERLRGPARPVRDDLGEGVCPLFFPLLVGDKRAAARRLWDRGIETVEFWNEGDPLAKTPGSAAELLRRHVLEVPIHQEIEEERLELMAREIGRADLGGPRVQ